jgi:hypothetical protein
MKFVYQISKSLVTQFIHYIFNYQKIICFRIKVFIPGIHVSNYFMIIILIKETIQDYYL